MRRALWLLPALVCLPCTCAIGSLAFDCDGTLTCGTYPLAVALDASLSLTYGTEGGSAWASADLDEAGLDVVVIGARASRDVGRMACETGATASFDATAAEWREGTLDVTLGFETFCLALGLLRQGKGVGGTIRLELPRASLLEEVSIGLNVDAFGRVQTESCQFPLTYAETRFSFSCACAEGVGTATFLATGFSDFVVSAASVGGMPFGVTLGVQVRYAAGESTLHVAPTLSLGHSECFELYAGLAWEQATATLSGIALYGVGLACEIGDVRVRGLWELDPNAISLVAEPYWALLGFVWDVSGCCGDGERSVAFFFGEDGLFGLGAMEFSIEEVATPGCTTSLTVTLKTSGIASLTFGWQVSF
ncbi:MAG: hypothetical protein AB1778_05690 [Candidatus Bipolaricaulota bacterium]